MWLSQNILIGWDTSTPSSLSKVFSQISSVSHCSLLCFCTRPCDNCLLLTLPRHKISTKKCAVSSRIRRPPIRRWAGPIRIFIGRKKKMSIRGISKTFPRRRLKIPQNSVHSFEMRDKWRVHKLTKDTNRIYKIRFGDSQVDKSTLPTSLLYIPGSFRSSPWSEQRQWFCSFGVSAGLAPKKQVSFKRSTAYFLWERYIPFLSKQLLFLGSTSEFPYPWSQRPTTMYLPLFYCLDIIPRKDNVINITTRTVVPSFLFLTNTEWSAWLLWKPNSCTALLNFSNQALFLVNGLLQSIYSLLQSTYFPFIPLWYESRWR